MANPQSPPEHATETPPAEAPRRACPAPADFRAEVARFDANASVGQWAGPRYRMTYRSIGEGPPLILCPGIAATYRGYALMFNLLASRFQCVVYDYPGENHGDGARLSKITHDDLVDDVFGLIDHLNFGRTFLFGPSFGSTIVLKSLHREPRRFPKAAIQGAFAHRPLAKAEKLALRFGRLLPGNASRLPLRNRVLAWNNKSHFPEIIADRWDHYVHENGLTPIAPMASRLDMLGRLDLRPILPKIPTDVLVLQGNEDRIVARRHYEELTAGLPHAHGVLMPLVGHQPHYTHAEGMAQALNDFLLPCAPGGCPNESAAEEIL
ncbi:MAG: putative hydrolase or acyltransferase of alpha/beta superfamily [Planctomycetota bacterium]|nr:putative hydrolase or acyltransferase of alpha/beta superfamily [Planctomycetota bacterium]